ncbi:MAG: hypothetical protein EOO75_19890 [Myxococcales bacterium]|nr:MAG: hypothetical protein EOO75_19890 [Myxococcales bacterium]
MGILATEAALALAPGALRLGRTVAIDSFGTGAELLDFAQPDVVLLVQSTFERLDGRWGEFAAHFYERLFDLAPAVAPLFAHVDMASQQEMLMKVLSTAIGGLDNLDPLVPVLRQLGARHVAYGAQPSHYKQVGRALLEALEKFLGPDFTPEVHLAWMEIFGTLAREMIAGSQEAPHGG